MNGDIPRLSRRDLAGLLEWEGHRLEKVIRRCETPLIGMGGVERSGLVTYLNRAQVEYLVEEAQVPGGRASLERVFGAAQAPGGMAPGSSPFDAVRRVDGRGVYWPARELMGLVGYDLWQRFEDVIERAAAADNIGNPSGNQIDGVGNVVNRPQGGGRELTDYRLTRYACYLVAMIGDPRKLQIAAQTRFAVQARRAEVAETSPAPYPRPRGPGSSRGGCRR